MPGRNLEIGNVGNYKVLFHFPTGVSMLFIAALEQFSCGFLSFSTGFPVVVFGPETVFLRSKFNTR